MIQSWDSILLTPDEHPGTGSVPPASRQLQEHGEGGAVQPYHGNQHGGVGLHFEHPHLAWHGGIGYWFVPDFRGDVKLSQAMFVCKEVKVEEGVNLRVRC